MIPSKEGRKGNLGRQQGATGRSTYIGIWSSTGRLFDPTYSCMPVVPNLYYAVVGSEYIHV